MSNLPLFILAGPMLFVLTWSSLLQLDQADERSRPDEKAQEIDHILRRLAFPQLVVAILALTSFHVQIVNRISSGYPLWYISLASSVLSNDPSRKGRIPWTKIGVCSMMGYAIVQAVLYSSFLPPA
jgi:GPI mannosyltransferase 2